MVHVRREANKSAHGLAQYAAGITDACIWFDCSPPCILNDGQADKLASVQD